MSNFNYSKQYLIPIDFSLDAGKILNKRITFTTGDINTCIMYFELSDKGERIDLTDKKVEVAVEREDKFTLETPCKIEDLKNGKVSVVFTTSMLYAGTNKLEVVVTTNDDEEEFKELISPRISYKVIPSIKATRDNNIENTNEYPILIKLIKNVKELKDDTESFLEQATEQENDRVDEFNKIKESNDKEIKELNQVRDNVVKNVDSKIDEINSTKTELIKSVNKKIEDIDNSVENSIKEMEWRVETEVSNSQSIMDNSVKKIDHKILEVKKIENDIKEDYKTEKQLISDFLNKSNLKIDNSISNAQKHFKEVENECNNTYDKKVQDFNSLMGDIRNKIDNEVRDVNEFKEGASRELDVIKSNAEKNINDASKRVDDKIIQLTREFEDLKMNNASAEIIESRKDVSGVIHRSLGERLKADLYIEDKSLKEEIISMRKDVLNEIGKIKKQGIKTVNSILKKL